MGGGARATERWRLAGGRKGTQGPMRNVRETSSEAREACLMSKAGGVWWLHPQNPASFRRFKVKLCYSSAGLLW